MSHHAHGPVEDDDHPGYSPIANASFLVSIPTLYLGGATALGVWDANEDLLVVFAVIAGICVGGGVIGLAWSALAGKRFGTGVAAILLGALALAMTAWAASA